MISSDLPISELTADSSESPRLSSLRIAGIAAIVYAALVLLMWMPYTMNSGIPYETAFPYMSDTLPLWDGFFYSSDPLRIHTNTFYHLAYLLGEALGIPGSFLTYQIVYAVLWWARGFLIFLILCRFLPDRPFLAFLAGGVALCHAADSALNWVGQLNQFGFLFWMVAGYYLLVVAYQVKASAMSWGLLAAATFCQYMSLWSYEAHILVLAALPLFLPLLKEGWTRRFWLLAGTWFAVIGMYVLLSIKRYLAVGGSSYQASVMRTDFSLAAILEDWWFNICSTLSFWEWSSGLSSELAWGIAALCGIAGVGVFACGAMLVWRNSQRQQIVNASTASSFRSLITVFVSAVLLLLLSHPVYLMLNSARMNWRTQFISGIAMGILVASAACLASIVIRQSKRSGLIAIALCAPVIFFGGWAAVRLGTHHDQVWQRHRPVLAAILETAPRLRDESVVILLNVPTPQSGQDPFGHCMWFDMAMRLAYPGTSLACNYFYADGKPAPGNNLKLTDELWEWDGTGFPPVVRKAGVAQTIVFDYNSDSGAQVVKRLPAWLQLGEAADRYYSPLVRVEAGPPSPMAVRRYQPKVVD